MAWIESHQSLGDHPKTIRAAAILKVDPAQMVGHLHYLWWWALDYAPEGDLNEFSDAEIAHACRWRKNAQSFVEALRACRFIEGETGHFQIHDWDLYAGRLLDKRRKDAARKRGSRADIQRTSSGHDADAPPDGARTARALPTVPNQPYLPNQPSPSAPVDGPRDGDHGFRQVTDALTRLGARLNALNFDDIGALLDEGYRPEWFEKACFKAAENDARSWAYVRKVITGWGLEGPPPERSNGNGGTHPRRSTVLEHPDDEDPLAKRLRLDAERRERERQLGVP